MMTTVVVSKANGLYHESELNKYMADLTDPVVSTTPCIPISLDKIPSQAGSTTDEETSSGSLSSPDDGDDEEEATTSLKFNAKPPAEDIGCVQGRLLLAMLHENSKDSGDEQDTAGPGRNKQEVAASSLKKFVHVVSKPKIPPPPRTKAPPPPSLPHGKVKILTRPPGMESGKVPSPPTLTPEQLLRDKDSISSDDVWPEFRPPPGLDLIEFGPPPGLDLIEFGPPPGLDLVGLEPPTDLQALPLGTSVSNGSVEGLPYLKLGPPPGLALPSKSRPLPPWRQKKIGLRTQASTSDQS